MHPYAVKYKHTHEKYTYRLVTLGLDVFVILYFVKTSKSLLQIAIFLILMIMIMIFCGFEIHQKPGIEIPCIIILNVTCTVSWEKS